MGRWRWKVWLVPVIILTVSAAFVRADQVLTGLGGGGGGGGVALQGSYPGTAQSGHANVTGTIGAGSFSAASTAANTNMLFFNNSTIADGRALFRFDVGMVTSHLSNSAPIFQFFSNGGRTMSLYSGKFDLSPLDAGNGGNWDCPTGAEVCLTGRWLGILSSGTAIITDTKPFAVANASLLLDMRNNGVTKFSVKGDGTLTTTTPIPLTSGGTGSNSTTPCTAGSFITNDGTSYTCAAVANGSVVASGRIAANGAIVVQYGQAITVTKGSTGSYTVNITGMTAATGVVMVTPIASTGDGAGRFGAASPGAGSFIAYIKTGADGAIDWDFMYTVEHL